MKVDGSIAVGLERVPAAIRELEDEGYDGVWTTETTHDPFLPLAVAASHGTSMDLGTAIAVAFARNPMTLAHVAYDLQKLSKGRFVLGLGSQIEAHITKRFSMQWSRPAERMREMVLAIRHIWGTWDGEHRLDFRGDFYQHTLTTPMFNPGPHKYGHARIFVAGVGEKMTEVAGEVADGFFCHGFTTAKYLQEVTLPALGRGLALSGRTLKDIEICGATFLVTGSDDEDLEHSIATARERIAFYGSTPAYRGVLELHGWSSLSDELHQLSKRGEWKQMSTLITDDVLDAFAVVGEPDTIGAQVASRFGGTADRMSFFVPSRGTPEDWRSVLQSVKAI